MAGADVGAEGAGVEADGVEAKGGVEAEGGAGARVGGSVAAPEDDAEAEAAFAELFDGMSESD